LHHVVEVLLTERFGVVNPAVRHVHRSGVIKSRVSIRDTRLLTDKN